MSEHVLTHRESNSQTAEAVDYYVGAYCGDVYSTTLDLFSRFQLVKKAPVYLREDLDVISGGVNVNGDPGIWIGLQEKTLTETMRCRIIERFGLTKKQVSNQVYMPFILAHEFGHVVQADPAFDACFGAINDDLVKPESDYESYINCDAELNADYIAAVIIGNSKLGIDIEFMPPIETPEVWRVWGKAHQVPTTVAIHELEAQTTDK